MTSESLIHNAREVVTVLSSGERLFAGRAMRKLAVFNNASIHIRDGKISELTTDPARKLELTRSVKNIIEAERFVVLPGFIDSHTHIVFGGSRENEFALRAEGKTYQEIREGGGGIQSSMNATRCATLEELCDGARKRLKTMLSFGVTTVEIKSGYGLSIEAELRMLRAIRKLQNESAQELCATFLGAHDVPPEMKQEEYVDHVVHEMLPRVTEEHLAEFCDVFVDKGYFTVSEGERISEAAKAHGMKIKLHADELADVGAAALAAKVGALSADHLLCVNEKGIAALRDRNVVATLLPITALVLDMPFAPARKIIDAGCAVALATDCNPGSSMSENFLLTLSLGMMKLKMSAEEVIVAGTFNAAAALGRSHHIGSIEVGKRADLVLFDVPSYQYIPYHVGVSDVVKVITKGIINYEL